MQSKKFSHRIFSFFVLLSLLLSFFSSQGTNPVGAQAEGPQPSSRKQVPSNTPISTASIPTDKIIVKFKETEKISEKDNSERQSLMASLSQSAGQPLAYFRSMSGGAHVLSLKEKQHPDTVAAIARKLMEREDVEYAEPDSIMRHTLEPNDPEYPAQWHYRYEPCLPGEYTCGIEGQSHGINLPAAWDITTGSENVVIAVLDTGILAHQDLTGRILPCYDFIHDPWVARDGNGRDADPSDPGDWILANECDYQHDPENSSWHGLHVAGTIAANGNNNLGVTGISWGSKILPVRVLGRCGGYLSDIADGMRWAAGLPVAGVPSNPTPANVLNLSLGGFGACDFTYQNTINDILTNTNATIVVAAGNSNINVSNAQPANCNGVISVAATDIDGWKSYYSNYGNLIKISAPGGDLSWDDAILSTLNNGTTTPLADTYTHYQGTSMAAPHVSGVIALMYSVNPTLSQTQVLQILQNTARDFPSSSNCATTTCGAGILDAAEAVQSALDLAPTFPDVPSDFWAWSFIERLANAGLTSGYPDGTYRPESNVTRAEIAIFLLKGINFPTPYSPPSATTFNFTDIESHWARHWIEALRASGITSGFSDGTFRPDNPVTRAEMAIFLLKAINGPGYSPPAAAATFSDTGGHWAVNWIEALRNTGLTSGYPDGTFRPDSPVTRAEMAVFIVNGFGLP